MGLNRIRVVGRYWGQRWDAGRAELEFGTVTELLDIPADGQEFRHVENTHIELGMAERLFEWVFVKGRGSIQEGQVCDLRCCVVDGDVEIMELRVLGARETRALAQFLHSEDGRTFLQLSQGRGTCERASTTST